MKSIYDSKNDLRKKLQQFYFVKISTLVLKYVKIDRFYSTERRTSFVVVNLWYFQITAEPPYSKKKCACTQAIDF